MQHDTVNDRRKLRRIAATGMAIIMAAAIAAGPGLLAFLITGLALPSRRDHARAVNGVSR